MSVGTSKSFLLASLTLLSVMTIGIQTNHENNSQTIFSSYLMTVLDLSMSVNQNTPSTMPNLMQSSTKDFYQMTAGYREEKLAERSQHGLIDSEETFGRDPDTATKLFELELDSSIEQFPFVLDSPAEMFDHVLDGSTETFPRVLDNKSAEAFYHTLDSSTERFDYDLESMIVTHGADGSTKPFASGQQISTEAIIYNLNKEAPCFLFQICTSTWENNHTVNNRSESSDKMNIKKVINGSPYSCDQRCGYVIAASDDNLYPCHCDPACWLYGDCCSDYYFICLQQNISATSDRILQAVLDRLETFSQVLQLREDYIWSRISYCSPLESNKYYFQLVNKCSDDPQILAKFEDLHRDLTNPLSESSDIFVELSKKEIRQRCERNSTSHTKHTVLDYTHVTLVHYTAIHFYNVFCAICNGINPSQVTVWEANVKCRNSTFNFMNTDLLVNDSISEAIMRNKCTITNTRSPVCCVRACVPQGGNHSDLSIQQDSGNTNYIPGSDIQSICMSWNYTTWLLCQRYQNPFLEPQSNRIYKNLHCLVCHLHAQAQILSNSTECILWKNSVMKLINECERDMYVCKDKSNYQGVINYGNIINSLTPIFVGGNRPDLEHGGKGDAITSLRIMYDFRSHQATVTVNHTVRTIEMKACPQDQVYLPQYQRCGQAFCPPGKRLLHDQCVSVCSDDDTGKKESCGNGEHQNFDSKYQPCPQGCTSVRLNIALDYILGLDTSSISLPNCNVMHFNINHEKHDDNNDSLGSNSSSSRSSNGGRASSRSRKSSNKCSNSSDGDGNSSSCNSSSSSSSSSSSNSSSNYSNIGNAANSTQIATVTNTVVENMTQPRNNITSSSPMYNIPFLFEVSNLKTAWVKQMNKKMNSTESRQTVYQELDKLVLRDILNKTVNHLGNTSQIDHFIVCRNYTCVLYNINMTEIDTSQRKVYPYNPCFHHSGRSNDIKYERIQRPGVCISFVIHLNSSNEFDTFVRSTKILVSDIVRSAYQTNFILSRMEITNMIDITNGSQKEHTGVRNSKGSNATFATSSGELCQNGEVLAYTETTVERYNNGTHAVNLNGTDINLVNILFSMEIYRQLDMAEKQVNLATVGWCQVELNILNCGSLPFALYEPDNFVIYNGTLVITSMADRLTQFLYNSLYLNHIKEDITDQMTLYAAKYGDNNWTIVQQGSYIQTRAGVLVCSNVSRMYLSEKDTLYNETVLRFIPDSEAEILATAIASGLSLFCLACTLSIYSLVPSLRNVPGKIVMSLSATLLCAQVLFLFCTKPKGLACEVYASIHHAAWLASYMWLGAMSVHLACILNSQCNIRINMTGSNIFKILTAVCWGIPCLLAGVCLALHKTKVITIGYGNNGVCWIGSMKPMLIFYGVPVFLILAVTLVSAVFVVRAIRKSITFRKKGAVLRGKPYKQLILCVNLSLLMGFSWVFYFLAVGTDNTIVWTVHILVNGSQGLYVFLCFAARKLHLSTLVTQIKVLTLRTRKSNVSSDIISLQTSPITATPLSSPCPSVRNLTISVK